MHGKRNDDAKCERKMNDKFGVPRASSYPYIAFRRHSGKKMTNEPHECIVINLNIRLSLFYGLNFFKLTVTQY